MSRPRNGVAAFRRAILEFLVIVTGVLAALAVDEWRLRRAEAVREREILADLVEEFEQNRVVLAEDLAWNRERLEDGLSWVELTEASVRPPQDSVFQVWEGLRSPLIFQPVSGVLQSVIDAGELRLVTNRDLRARLTNWLRMAEETGEGHRLYASFWTELIVPVQVEGGSIDDPSTAAAALDNDVLANLYRRLNRNMSYGANRNDLVFEELEALIQALETELESR